MELLPLSPTAKAPAEKFTGDCYVDTICVPMAPSNLVAAYVHFAPGARTAWHSHPTGQTLHCTAGSGLVGTRDGTVALTPGRTVQIAPDEEHWHGAMPKHFMTHIALVRAPETGPETIWGEQVTVEDYEAAAAAPGD